MKLKSQRINFVNKIVKTIFQITNCAIDEIYFYYTRRLIVVKKVFESHKRNSLFVLSS